jgi:hypothetical protein
MPDGATIHQIRDQLPPALSWTYRHDDAEIAVTLGLGHCWPDVLVIVEQRGTGLRVAGQFGDDGHLRQFTVETTSDEADITTAVLRRPTLAALRAWHKVSRERIRQILDGVPEESIVFDGCDAAAAMRVLAYAAGQTAAPRRHRGTRLDDLIREVAGAYRDCVAAGDKHPRVTLAEAFGLGHAHVGRLLTAARRERNGQSPHLGPARRGVAGEAEPMHR